MTIGCTNDRYVADAKVCQVLGQMLSRAGFRMQVETQPGSIILTRARAQTNDLPLFFAGQSSSTSRDPTHVLSLAAHSPDPKTGIGVSNRGDFRDAGLDAAIEAAVARTDDRRQEALRAAMLQAVDLGALIPLYEQVVVVATRAGIAYAPRMDEQTVAQNARPK
jgi:peptide/nickel transport system substrate-binding protein